MKKNRRLFITTLICILLILSLWILKENQSSAIIKKPMPIENKNNLSNPILVDTSANLKSNSKNHIQISNLDNEAKPEKKYSEEECWEIVKKQYIANPKFITNNLNVLNTVVGQWYYSNQDITPTQEESVSGKFMLAIGKAGLLEGKKIQQNRPESIKLLNEVITMDPQNSAPRIFLAIIKSQHGSKNEVQDILNQIESQTTNFNSYTLNITQTLYRQIKTPEDMIAAYDVWTHTPILNYNELGKFLKLHKLEKIAEQLLIDGLSEKKIAEDINWHPVEYAIGKDVINKLRRQNKYPSWKETYNSKRAKYLKELGHSTNNGICNMNILNEHVQLLPNYLWP